MFLEGENYPQKNNLIAITILKFRNEIDRFVEILEMMAYKHSYGISTTKKFLSNLDK